MVPHLWASAGPGSSSKSPTWQNSGNQMVVLRFTTLSAQNPCIVSKLLSATIWSSCAVLFKSQQTPFPWGGRLFRSAALHRIHIRTCSFVVIFLLRYQWMIERLSKEMGTALVSNREQLLANSIKNFISDKKTKWLVAALNLQSIETFLTLELSQYSKSGSMFSSSKPVAQLVPASGRCTETQDHCHNSRISFRKYCTTLTFTHCMLIYVDHNIQ